MAKSNILNFKVTIGTSTCKFNKYLLFLLTCGQSSSGEKILSLKMEQNKTLYDFFYYMPQYVLFCKQWRKHL